jgi:hypothetical protein
MRIAPFMGAVIMAPSNHWRNTLVPNYMRAHNFLSPLLFRPNMRNLFSLFFFFGLLSSPSCASLLRDPDPDAGLLLSHAPVFLPAPDDDETTLSPLCRSPVFRAAAAADEEPAALLALLVPGRRELPVRLTEVSYRRCSSPTAVFGRRPDSSHRSPRPRMSLAVVA